MARSAQAMQSRAFCLALLVLGAAAVDTSAAVRGRTGMQREQSLLQSYNRALDTGTGKGKDTPVTRVVNLLKGILSQLDKEMEEDEGLFDKLACWCNNNEYAKGESIEESQAKIAELESTIESLTAKSAGLKTTIQELEAEFAADKASLAEAQANRDKELKAFHGEEMDSIQAIENLKAAMMVLSKHHGNKGGLEGVTLLQLRSKDEPWDAHAEYHIERPLDEFMRSNGMYEGEDTASAEPIVARPHKFLQQSTGDASEATATASMSAEDEALVRRALKQGNSFLQAHGSDGYFPKYEAQSGEIVGIMKQMMDEMKEDLTQAQEQERNRASSFAELKAAKSAAIESGEKMAEQKEDELATTDNELAEAKEDLGQEKAALGDAQKFSVNLKKTCDEATANFEARKKSRLEEIKAVTETIEILTEDEARDAMASTFNFLQVSESSRQRRRAAQTLRRAAAKSHNAELSVLADSVELDAFGKVKKAIDDMVTMLQTQQADEVKKNDWCKDELQENEMQTMKEDDHKADLEAKAAECASTIKTLEEGIASAQQSIAQQQLDLQRASEDRKKENLDYQVTIADQMAVIAVLKKALDRLNQFYGGSFLQVKKSSQTPPVPQMEYKPSEGSSGVVEMIEKLMEDSRQLMADSKKSEVEAQAAYEDTVAETFSSVATLQREIATKSKDMAETKKEKLQTESDLMDSVGELEGLHKYNIELHGECDYVLKNFMKRQEARGQEIEALQQAKQILSGASLG